MTDSDSAQPLTDDARAWVAEQKAAGYSRQALFKSLCEVGWQRNTAAHALDLTPIELAAMLDPADLAEAGPLQADAVSLPGVRLLPFVTLDASGCTVDAGDKWVQVVTHLAQPDLWVFANLLSDTECSALVDAARERLSRSLTVDTQTGGEALNHARTSQGMFFVRGEDEVVSRIEKRIARLLNWPLENGEGLQVLRYGPGAEYKPHYDYFDPRESGTPLILKRGGQRVATLIMYLYEPEAGGATVFPDVNMRVEPRRGSAVFFSYPLAHPASMTLHGGDPVSVGEKWIATKWLREREFV